MKNLKAENGSNKNAQPSQPRAKSQGRPGGLPWSEDHHRNRACSVSVRARHLDLKGAVPDHRIHVEHGGDELQGGDVANSTLALRGRPGLAYRPDHGRVVRAARLRALASFSLHAATGAAATPRYGYPLPVCQASSLLSGFLQTRSHPRNPCRRPTLPLAGRVADFHLQVSAPMLGAPKKSRL